MSFGLITHATELPTIAAGYESDDMMDVKADLEMLRELPLQAAAAVRILTQRLDTDYPLDPVVIESLNELYQALCRAANPADEVAAVFAAAHEADIQRRRAPRTNEQAWNHR